MYRRPSNSRSLNSSAGNSPVLLMTPPILGRGRAKQESSNKVDDARFEGFDGVHRGATEHTEKSNRQSRAVKPGSLLQESDAGYFDFDVDQIMAKSVSSTVEQVVESDSEIDRTDQTLYPSSAFHGRVPSVKPVFEEEEESDPKVIIDEIEKNVGGAVGKRPDRSNSSSPGLVDEMRKISIGSHGLSSQIAADDSFGSSIYDSVEDRSYEQNRNQNRESFSKVYSQDYNPSYNQNYNQDYDQNFSGSLISKTRVRTIQIAGDPLVRSPKVRSPENEIHSRAHSRAHSPSHVPGGSNVSLTFAEMQSLKGSIHSLTSTRTRDVEDESIEPDDRDDGVEIIEGDNDNQDQVSTPGEQTVFYSLDHSYEQEKTPESYRFLSSQTSSPSEPMTEKKANVKLYHPKPQRLVSSTLAETPSVLQEGGDGLLAPPEEPITTEPSPDISEQTLPAMAPALEAPVYSYESAASVEETRNEAPLVRGTVMEGSGYKRQSTELNRQSVEFNRHSIDTQRFSRQPTSNVFETENPEGLVFYPAPIPVQLRLPPLLSKKNKKGIPADVKARRRSSVPLAPPTWVVNPVDRASLVAMGQPLNSVEGAPSIYSSVNGFDRSPSPSLSIDSGRATIEDDDDERNLGDEDEDNERRMKKKRDKKKKKRRRFSRKTTMDADGNAVDSDEFDYSSDNENAELDATADHLAFTSFNPNSISAAVLQSGTVRAPKSLIEELELRKAGKKIQTQRVRTKLDAINAEVKATSNHPMDYRQTKSLLELNHIANRDYQNQVQLNKYSRVTRRLEPAPVPPVEDDIYAEEPLSARRARLRAQKEAQAKEIQYESETLAERRARLKRERESRAQPSLVA